MLVQLLLPEDTIAPLHAGASIGLGLLSSPEPSVGDFGSGFGGKAGSGGGVVLTSTAAAAMQNAVSPGLSGASSLSPFAASLVGVCAQTIALS